MASKNSGKMIRLLVPFLLSIFVSLSAFGQKQMTIKIGASFSDLHYKFSEESEESRETQIYTGPLAGVDIRWSLSSHWSLRNGVYYSRRGRANYSPNSGKQSPRDLTIHSVSSPILAEFFISQKIAVYLGLELNYILRSSHNFYPEFHRFGYGPSFGFTFQKKNLIVEIGGTYSLKPFHEFPLAQDPVELSLKQIQLSVGYVIK